MAAFYKLHKNLPAAIAAALIPVVVYVATLWIPIPPSLSGVVFSYSTLGFLLTFLLYFLSFRLPSAYRWTASASLTMLLLGVTVSFLWHSGFSDDKIIAGLLPFRDAFDYYNGAKWILGGELIKSINEGASWRPLYPGFLASLLWLTGQNLQWTLGIQVALAGLCFSVSAQHVQSRLGPAAAAFYLTLLFFYIQPLIGTAYTETLGLALGCLGFVLLWSAGESRSLVRLIGGLVMLMIAVSERAGAFFVFPVLVLWAGWAFRGAGRFSLRHAGISLLTVTLTYLVVNTVYDRLMVEPGSFAFGNFAFTLYGQVTGGSGYHKAFEDLGVRNPAIILRAAERFFVAHPIGFVAGAAKAYRDFFYIERGALSLGPAGDVLVWIIGSLLLLLGIFQSVRKINLPQYSLLIAAFIGILLSVPFLPPIDGGIRIYASTMPFVYALPAVGISLLVNRPRSDEESRSAAWPVWLSSAVLVGAVVILPVLILRFSARAGKTAAQCPAGQVSFQVSPGRGSYIDLVPAGAGSCGRLPEVCLSDFRAYSQSNDPGDVQVYENLTGAASAAPLAVFAGNDLVGGRPHLFVGPHSGFDVLPPNALISGCATETLIKGRPSIYSIQSLNDAVLVPVH
jgi:hypothetical protein